MTTLTRSTSKVTPSYKEFLNFVDAYKDGNKNEFENSDVKTKNFILSTNTSSSTVNSDVTDFSKNSCVSYNSFLETTRNKKFNPVKPKLESSTDFSNSNSIANEEKNTKKSEIFIEIQPRKTVSEVSRMFENKQNRKAPPKSAKINSKINIFEKQISLENKPKIAEKPGLGNRSPPPKIETEIKLVAQENNNQPPKMPVNGISTPPPPPMMHTIVLKMPVNSISSPPPPPPPPMMHTILPKMPVSGISSPPPPPPPPMINTTLPKPEMSHKSSLPLPPPPPPPMNGSPKMQATLIKGPQIKHVVSNPNGVVPNEIDRNDPMVRKLVYGTLRGLYGAYHDKANDMMATLPKHMVKKTNGVQDIIEQIASNGDLEKLNGRVNPKKDQD